MTPTPITCELFADHLAGLLERELDEATRARLEAHAAGCESCGALVADLRRLQADAANLPELAPSRDLWPAIAERIATPVVELTPGGRIPDRAVAERPRGLRGRRIGVWVGAAAAAAVVAATALVTHRQATRAAAVAPRTASAPVAQPTEHVVPATVAATTPDSTSAPTAAPRARSAAPRVQTVLASNRPTAEQTYDAEIKGLRAVIAQRRSLLDSSTVAVIERNLRVIDDAIAQCRDALRKDPASRFLMESLNDALDTKVHLLRTAAMLPART